MMIRELNRDDLLYALVVDIAMEELFMIIHSMCSAALLVTNHVNKFRRRRYFIVMYASFLRWALSTPSIHGHKNSQRVEQTAAEEQKNLVFRKNTANIGIVLVVLPYWK